MFLTSTIWAISPEYLKVLADVWQAAARVDPPAAERLSDQFQAASQPYQVIGPDSGGGHGVAVVSLVGLLVPRATWWLRLLGGTSLKSAAARLNEAAADPEVSHIVLEIDSPGGQVAGTQAFANRIREVRASGKRVTAWVDGMGASAAYWIASAAERVVIADQTTIVGSIGVVATHVDISKREEQFGFKTTEVTAGRYKSIASEYAPLSEEGRSTLQEKVDEIYRVFVDSVASNRRVTTERVLTGMADGRVFVGDRAISAGLADEVASLEAVISGSRAQVLTAGTHGARGLLSEASAESTAVPSDPAPLRSPTSTAATTVRTSGQSCQAFLEAREGFKRLLELRYGYDCSELPKQTGIQVERELFAALDGVDVAGDVLDALGRRRVVQAASQAANYLRANGIEPTGSVPTSH